MHSLDENPGRDEGFNLEIGDKGLKKNMPKGKPDFRVCIRSDRVRLVACMPLVWSVSVIQAETSHDGWIQWRLFGCLFLLSQTVLRYYLVGCIMILDA